MPKIVGVKFKKSPKIYYFDAGNREYKENCFVIVETARGVEFGEVKIMPTEVRDEDIVAPLKPIIRIATEKDIAQDKRNSEKRNEVYPLIEKKIADSKLKMRLSDVEYTFDGNKLIIYFTADSRIDFRELVKDLAASFRTRIELRQIGPRDECKMIGGLAPCGRACCCSDHISEFAHVTIKMAKNQNLSLNSAKISGLCGRLMPKVGSTIKTKKDGAGVVEAVNQLSDTVTFRKEKKGDVEHVVIPAAEITAVYHKGAEIPDDDVDDEELKKLQD